MCNRFSSSTISTASHQLVDAQRTLFIKKCHPADYNLQMETLKMIAIDEDAFFEHTLSEDIVRIMRDIRKRHLGDIESRTDTAFVDKMVAVVTAA